MFTCIVLTILLKTLSYSNFFLHLPNLYFLSPDYVFISPLWNNPSMFDNVWHCRKHLIPSKNCLTRLSCWRRWNLLNVDSRSTLFSGNDGLSLSHIFWCVLGSDQWQFIFCNIGLGDSPIYSLSLTYE